MTRWLMILVVLSTVILAGCLGATMPLPPTNPTLQTTPHPSDPRGRCLDSNNLEQLLLYIHRLEDGYK